MSCMSYTTCHACHSWFVWMHTCHACHAIHAYMSYMHVMHDLSCMPFMVCLNACMSCMSCHTCIHAIHACHARHAYWRMGVPKCQCATTIFDLVEMTWALNCHDKSFCIAMQIHAMHVMLCIYIHVIHTCHACHTWHAHWSRGSLNVHVSPRFFYVWLTCIATTWALVCHTCMACLPYMTCIWRRGP